MNVPKTPISSKLSRRTLVQTIYDLRKEIFDLKRDQVELIEKAVDKAIETKTQYIEARLALKEANVLKRLLYRKGILTEREFIDEHKKV